MERATGKVSRVRVAAIVVACVVPSLGMLVSLVRGLQAPIDTQAAASSSEAIAAGWGRWVPQDLPESARELVLYREAGDERWMLTFRFTPAGQVPGEPVDAATARFDLPRPFCRALPAEERREAPPSLCWRGKATGELRYSRVARPARSSNGAREYVETQRCVFGMSSGRGWCWTR